MSTEHRSITKKNVTLVPYLKDGVSTYKLLGPAGEIKAFTIFADTLLRYKFNTRRTYCQHLALFFDFFFEACFHLMEQDATKIAVTKDELRRVIEAWHDYLVVGESSGKELVRLVCRTLPSPLNSHNTSSNKHAALQLFLQISEELREETAQLASIGLLSGKNEFDISPLFAELNRVIPLRLCERQALRQNSMLGGAIHGSGAISRTRRTIGFAEVAKYNVSRAFPLELFTAFIAALRSYRDKAIYCLYAACGCRSIEALQLLFEDLLIERSDPAKNRVFLIDPKRRWNHPSYRALSAKDRDRLAWKGRQNDIAFLIEPFATLFFENLELYLSHEYYPHNKHSFLFQNLRSDESRGTPYFLTAPQTRQQVFDAAARKAGIPDTVEGPHSFRHAYGTYLLNYFPRGNGQFGLPMGIVRVMMGHAKISSTEKYALHDTDLIDEHLSFAKALLYPDGNFQSFVEQKLSTMRARLVAYERLWQELSRVDENA